MLAWINQRPAYRLFADREIKSVCQKERTFIGNA